jgi:hypothetical protein
MITNIDIHWIESILKEIEQDSDNPWISTADKDFPDFEKLYQHRSCHFSEGQNVYSRHG